MGERAGEWKSAARSGRTALALSCLVVITACLIARAWFGPLPSAMRENLVCVLGAGLAWWCAIELGSQSAIQVRWLWIGWVVTRAIALCADPGTSDDIWRYVWEGGLVSEGISPYAHAPAGAELAAWRSVWPEVFRQMNNQQLSAIYPPVAQAAFAAAVTAVGGPQVHDGEAAKLALRILFCCADAFVLYGLLRLLGARGLAPARALAWAWSPLIALEFAGAGHLDSLGIALLVGALAASARGYHGWLRALLLVCAGALVKLVPLVALPWVARARGDSEPIGGWWPDRRTLAGVLIVGVCFAAACLSLLGLQGGLGGLARGLGEYGFRWEAASLVYRFVERPLGRWFAFDEGPTDPRRLAKYLLALVILVLALRQWRRTARAEQASFVLIGAWLVLAPTLHPWYLAWVLPFVCLDSSRAWRTLIVLIPLAYWPLEAWRTEQVWQEPGWLWPVLAIPFFALLAVELWSSRSRA
jgi:hypothetical protein